MYAEKEASALISDGPTYGLVQSFRDPILRRQWLRQATKGLPLRPWLVWAYLMFLRVGILDGPPGWEYCRRRRIYERMVHQRYRALLRERGTLA